MTVDIEKVRLLAAEAGTLERSNPLQFAERADLLLPEMATTITALVDLIDRMQEHLEEGSEQGREWLAERDAAREDARAAARERDEARAALRDIANSPAGAYDDSFEMREKARAALGEEAKSE